VFFVCCARDHDEEEDKKRRSLEERKSSFADLKRMGSLAEIKRQTSAAGGKEPMSPSAFTMPNPWLRGSGAGAAASASAAVRTKGGKRGQNKQDEPPAPAPPHRQSYLAFFQRRPSATVHAAEEEKSGLEASTKQASVGEDAIEAMLENMEAGAADAAQHTEEVSTGEYTSEEEDEDDAGAQHMSEEHIAELMEEARKRGSNIVHL